MTARLNVRPLSELVEGGRISYGIVQPGGNTTDGVPIVRVKDIRNGSIDTSHPLRVAPSIAANHSRTSLRGGELLLSLVGTVGESAVVPTHLAGWNVARAIAVIRPRDIEAHWLQLFLELTPSRERLNSVLNTTVQSTLNLSDLRQLPILVPPVTTRRRIIDVIGALDDKITINTAIARSTDRYLEALLAHHLGSVM